MHKLFKKSLLLVFVLLIGNSYELSAHGHRRTLNCPRKRIVTCFGAVALCKRAQPRQRHAGAGKGRTHAKPCNRAKRSDHAARVAKFRQNIRKKIAQRREKTNIRRCARGRCNRR